MKDKPSLFRVSCVAVVLSILSLVAARGQATPEPQLPPVGIIDFYGLRRTSEQNVRSILKIKAGDDALKVARSSEESRKLLKSLPGVADAAVNVICCDDVSGKSIVFVGVRETGAPVLKFRPSPGGTIRLPKVIVQAGKDFDQAFVSAIEAKDFSEDDCEGHAFFGNQAVRAVQKRFVGLAAEDLPVLRRVLRESSDHKERAVAAQVIAYYTNKKAIVADLLHAATDADETVRNNAVRALIILAGYAQTNPRLKIRIPADVFVPMLDSLEWTDRNKAIGVIEALTRSRDARLLARLKKDSLAALTEMAGWTSRGHADGAFLVLGRVAGFPEAEIETMRPLQNRDKQIQKILQTIEKRVR